MTGSSSSSKKAIARKTRQEVLVWLRTNKVTLAVATTTVPVHQIHITINNKMVALNHSETVGSGWSGSSPRGTTMAGSCATSSWQMRKVPKRVKMPVEPPLWAGHEEKWSNNSNNNDDSAIEVWTARITSIIKVTRVTVTSAGVGPSLVGNLAEVKAKVRVTSPSTLLYPHPHHLPPLNEGYSTTQGQNHPLHTTTVIPSRVRMDPPPHPSFVVCVPQIRAVIPNISNRQHLDNKVVVVVVGKMLKRLLPSYKESYEIPTLPLSEEIDRCKLSHLPQSPRPPRPTARCSHHHPHCWIWSSSSTSPTVF